jgi:hypothetical protein
MTTTQRRLATAKVCSGFRTASSQGAAVRTSGVVGWTLVDGSRPATRFAVAWDVGNGGKASKFSASLGSFVPAGDEMWMPAQKMITYLIYFHFLKFECRHKK